MMREDVDYHLTVLDSAARGDLLAQHGLLAVVVHERTENELSALTRSIKRPSGQTPRDFLHVL
jgi:hypothetical protein